MALLLNYLFAGEAPHERISDFGSCGPEVNDLQAAHCAPAVEFWRDEPPFREWLRECGPKENLAEA